ncbi:hypothetical protein [Pseudomonas sp. OTU5201]|uniref:hypothetical protein n=1 Tax=Pseudomonas sp. OTU5201 TaxID=3043850 RepID=UPI00313A9EEC
MELLERLKRYKIIAFIVFMVAVIGGINTLTDFTKHDWVIGVGNWIATHTDWLSADVTVPVWSLIPVLTLVVLAAAYLFRQLSERGALNDPEERVLFWATDLHNSRVKSQGPTPTDIANVADLPLTEVEASLDVLKRKGFVLKKRYKSDPISITANGRDYLRQQDVMSRHAAFSVRATPAIIQAQSRIAESSNPRKQELTPSQLRVLSYAGNGSTLMPPHVGWLTLVTALSDLEVRHAVDVLVERELATHRPTRADGAPIVQLTAAGRDYLMQHRKPTDASTD